MSLQHPGDTALAQLCASFWALCFPSQGTEQCLGKWGNTEWQRGLSCKSATPWMWLKILKSTLEGNVRVHFVHSEMWPVAHKCLVFGQGLRLNLVEISGWMWLKGLIKGNNLFSNCFFCPMYLFFGHTESLMNIWDTKNYLKGIQFYIEVCTFWDKICNRSAGVLGLLCGLPYMV